MKLKISLAMTDVFERLFHPHPRIPGMPSQKALYARVANSHHSWVELDTVIPDMTLKVPVETIDAERIAPGEIITFDLMGNLVRHVRTIRSIRQKKQQF